MTDQLARGSFTGFDGISSPFSEPNAMPENIRRWDDHMGLYTLQPPQPVGTPLPINVSNGDGQVFADGTYAVYNGGSWRNYDARAGIIAKLIGSGEVWVNTGTAWVSHAKEVAEQLAAGDGAGYIGFRQVGAGAILRQVMSKLLEQSASPLDFGAVANGMTDATAALQRLYASGASSVAYPQGTYLVTGNFPRPNIIHVGSGVLRIVDGADELTVSTDSYETHGPTTVYVDPVNGSDTDNHGLSRSYPFKTVQRAFDSLPLVIRHQQTIVVTGGIVNTSSRSPLTMPRPAIFYPQGKFICPRTDSSGSNATGMVVIKGEAGATIQTDPVAGYPYGIYNPSSEIALQDLKVRPGPLGTTQVLVTVNRLGYTYMRRVEVDAAYGAGSALGVVVESGSWLEAIDCTLSGATAYDLVVYSGSTASVARPGGVGVVDKALVTGTLDLAVGARLTGNSLVTAGGKLSLTGTSSNRLLLSGDINVDPGGVLAGAYANLTGNIVGRGVNCRLSACGWSKTITMLGGSIRLDGSASYVSPATMSEVSTPLVLRYGAQMLPESTAEVRNNANELIGPDYGRQVAAPNADGYVIPITSEGQHTNMTLNASGAHRSNCTLSAAPQGAYPNTPFGDGDMLYVTAAGAGSYTTHIVPGSTAQPTFTDIPIGVGSGCYTGATFVFDASLKRWKLQGLGYLVP